MHVTSPEVRLAPELVALRLGRTPGLAWLDGGVAHGREGRFSFVGSAPCEVRERRFGSPRPFALLTELNRCVDLAEPRGAPPGAPLHEDVPLWIGHVGYDAHWSGQTGLRHRRDGAVPVVRFARYDALYAYDHEEARAYIVGDDAAACARLAARLEGDPLADCALGYASADLSVTDPAQHRSALRTALAHIRDGNVYEINLARRYRARFEGSALGLFLRMRALSPVPLGYFVEADDHAVLGRSMERFLRYRTRDRAVWTSPIKGTIAREGDDAGEAQRLSTDPKEHAEHAMVVDLMRNDLSRVSEPGSVVVRELMAVLPFAGLSHLVSTVAGRVQPGLSLEGLLAGTFPPGSVTGTPKRRAMELIEELEPAARGVYTGALGFVDRAGGCSLSVAIRTAVTQGGSVEYFAGGGIVAASDPERETLETDLKAQVFLRALRRQ